MENKQIMPSDFMDGQLDTISDILEMFAAEYLQEQGEYVQRRHELVLKKAS